MALRAPKQAYVLIESLRRLGLKDTQLAKAQAGRLRLKLLKIGSCNMRARLAPLQLPVDGKQLLFLPRPLVVGRSA